MAEHDIAEPRGPLTAGPVAKHVQLRDLLVETIRRDLAPGDAIPSERVLMSTYDVSRSTVRTAIDALISEGLLERAHGKGTYVAQPRLGSRLHLASFTHDMRRRGVEPSTRVITVATGRSTEEVATALGLAQGQTAWHVVRLRLADGVPMAVEDGWYPLSLFPDLDAHDLTGSLYQVLADHYETVIDTAEQTTWADRSDEELARHLEVEVGAPLLLFRRTSLAGRTPVEHVVSAYRGDRYQLHMALTRSMLG